MASIKFNICLSFASYSPLKNPSVQSMAYVLPPDFLFPCFLVFPLAIFSSQIPLSISLHLTPPPHSTPSLTPLTPPPHSTHPLTPPPHSTPSLTPPLPPCVAGVLLGCCILEELVSSQSSSVSHSLLRLMERTLF